ncbi:hypothetical protein [Nostoc sp.]|uniref:hypothetical protein n=1 Tax=Nostoc sp. TaxID=1180 RepID=UPI002FF8FE5A
MSVLWQGRRCLTTTCYASTHKQQIIITSQTISSFNSSNFGSLIGQAITETIPVFTP